MIQKIFSLTLIFVMTAFISSYGQEMTTIPRHCVKMQKQCSKVLSQSSTVTVSLPSVPDRGALTVGNESTKSTNCKPVNCKPKDCDPRQCEPAKCLPENGDPEQCKARVCLPKAGEASTAKSTATIQSNTCQRMAVKEDVVKL